jgi:hypothetical protein
MSVNYLYLNQKKIAPKIIGRALLWTLINGERYLDRIYYNQMTPMFSYLRIMLRKMVGMLSMV